MYIYISINILLYLNEYNLVTMCYIRLAIQDIIIIDILLIEIIKLIN